MAESHSYSHASKPSDASSQSLFERAFRMVIHLPNDRKAQRMACLDTCADIDVISHRVVKTLELETVKYSGTRVRPLGPETKSYMPEEQVTLDWHVAKFYKTYTTTFVVFNEEHSNEFDVLLGQETIKKIGFYKRNHKIWSSAGGEVCPSDEIETKEEAFLMDQKRLGIAQRRELERREQDNKEMDLRRESKKEKQEKQEAQRRELEEKEQEKQEAERNAQVGNPTVEMLEEYSSAPSLTDGGTVSTSGSISTSGSFEEIQGATEELAQLLLEDDALSPLYPKALDLVKVQEFEQSFTKLLKACAVELQAEATSRLQQIASDFLRARARLVVNHMGKKLDPSENARAQRMSEFALQQPKKRELLESYLARLQPGENETVATDIPERDTHSESGDSEQEPHESPKLYHLEEIKIFVLGSTALINLREKFRHMVLRRHFDTKSPTGPILDSPSVPNAISLLSEKAPTHAELDKSHDHDHAARAQDPADYVNQPTFVYLNRFVRMMVRVAGYIGLWEKPLKPGLKRVCGASLYDDFREQVHGSLDALQRQLNDHKGTSQSAATGSSVPEASQSAESNSASASDITNPSSTTTSTAGSSKKEDDDIAHGHQFRGLRHRGQKDKHLGGTADDSKWILPIFHYERNVMKVEQLSVDKELSDLALFEMIKESYHQSKSSIRRLLAMRGVTEISCVKAC
ncbi:MAG: hypothetical protein Q9209_005274 [Squamulea sp. 1 TL-2023]